jgi:hypothetical protein
MGASPCWRTGSGRAGLTSSSFEENFLEHIGGIDAAAQAVIEAQVHKEAEPLPMLGRRAEGYFMKW